MKCKDARKIVDNSGKVSHPSLNYIVGKDEMDSYKIYADDTLGWEKIPDFLPCGCGKGKSDPYLCHNTSGGGSKFKFICNECRFTSLERNTIVQAARVWNFLMKAVKEEENEKNKEEKSQEEENEEDNSRFANIEM